EQVLRSHANPAALDFALDRPKQIVLAGEPTAFLAKLRKVYVPNRVVLRVDGKPSASQLAEGKTARGGKPTAYVCVGNHCGLRTGDPDVVERRIAKAEPLP